jgi:hypothetical protein
MESRKIKTDTIKVICLLLFVAATPQSQAQKIWTERKGSISAQGNLAPGYLFAQKSVSAYVNGDVEIFIDDRASFIGQAWISFATTEKNKAGLRANHAIFWGANYHFLKPGRWDPYVGFTPGMGLVRAGYKSGEDIKLTPFSVVPLVSISAGCNYYVGSIFHFFVKVQGVSGQMFSDLPVPKRLDELKFMAGLGWNLRMWKPKKHDTWKQTTG